LAKVIEVKPLRRWCDEYRGGYQIPEHITADRLFTFPNTGDEDFLCGISAWVMGLGELEGVRTVIFHCHFTGPRMLLSDASEVEPDQRVNTREEWLCIHRHNSIFSFKDFNIFRANTTWNDVVWDG